MKGGILIQCFPGQGLVGRIAGMQLIDYFKAQEVAKIYSSYFPHLVIFNGEQGKLIHAELYAVESNPPLLILTGETQPQEGVGGMFQVLNSVLDIAEEWGIETVIAIGGFKAAQYKGTPESQAFAYSEKDLQKLKDQGIEIFAEGRVSGAVGVLTALAAERGFSSYGLMGKVRPTESPSVAFGVDPQAAKNVLKVVKELINLDIDLSKMDKMIEEIEQTEANAMKVIEDLTKAQAEKQDRRFSYI